MAITTYLLASYYDLPKPRDKYLFEAGSIRRRRKKREEMNACLSFGFCVCVCAWLYLGRYV